LGVDFWKKFDIATELFQVTTAEPERYQLSGSQESRLAKVRVVFLSYEKIGLGRTKLLKRRIESEEGAVPVKSRHYLMSPAKHAAVYAEVDEMLRLGLNHFYQKRRPETCLLQNELEEESRPITEFTVPGRPLYQFVIMLFALFNAGQSLCRLMEKVIPSKLREKVFVYPHDLPIVTPDLESHLSILKEVGECLKAAGLTIGLKKSHFCFKELRYLGFVIGGGELRTDPKKE